MSFVDSYMIVSYTQLTMTAGKCEQDMTKVFEYSVQLLRLCCIYMEFSDAIREGVMVCVSFSAGHTC